MKSEKAETLEPTIPPKSGMSAASAEIERSAARSGIALGGAQRAGGSLLLERRLLRKLLSKLGDPPFCIVLWDGSAVHSGPSPAIATVRVLTRGAFYRMLWDPQVHFGDDYANGELEVEGDLVQLLSTLYRAVVELPPGSGGFRLVPGHRRLRRNTLEGSREHIHHHYDIGNAFYRLWLDAEMQYTCAYFPRAEATLEEAQLAKLDHVCRKLRLKPGDTVVEAGCGWGGLALHMARRYGVSKVRAFNISDEQVRFARERAAREGFADRVEYVLDDYRNISGQYDAFVSVGMLEHVGPDNYSALGEVVHGALTDQGRGLIHTIGRNRPALMNPWIEKRIFPGAHPPALSEMMAIFEARRFSVVDVENLRPHYAKTLHHWLTRFEAAGDEVRARYDERFLRTWRLYLAGSEAAFIGGDLQVFQVVFTRPYVNDIPLTRAYLYRDE